MKFGVRVRIRVRVWELRGEQWMSHVNDFVPRLPELAVLDVVCMRDKS